MIIEAQIVGKLQQLRLAGMLETLGIRVKQAEESNSGYLDFLWTLLEDEYEKRQSRSLLIRLKKAGFEEEKTLEGFDFSFNPQERPISHKPWDILPAGWAMKSSLPRRSRCFATYMEDEQTIVLRGGLNATTPYSFLSLMMLGSNH